MTMNDVARAAGASLKTVSRVINDDPTVQREYVESVRTAVSVLGFRRNEIARTLRSGQTSSTIGLVIEDLANPFYSAIASAVERVAAEYRTLLITASSEENLDRGRGALQELLQRRVDGLLIVPAGVDHGFLRAEMARGVSVVFLDRPPTGLDADTVLVDNVGGARSGVGYMLARGHRRIGMLLDSLTIFTMRERLALKAPCCATMSTIPAKRSSLSPPCSTATRRRRRSSVATTGSQSEPRSSWPDETTQLPSSPSTTSRPRASFRTLRFDASPGTGLRPSRSCSRPSCATSVSRRDSLFVTTRPELMRSIALRHVEGQAGNSPLSDVEERQATKGTIVGATLNGAVRRFKAKDVPARRPTDPLVEPGKSIDWPGKATHQPGLGVGDLSVGVPGLISLQLMLEHGLGGKGVGRPEPWHELKLGGTGRITRRHQPGAHPDGRSRRDEGGAQVHVVQDGRRLNHRTQIRGHVIDREDTAAGGRRDRPLEAQVPAGGQHFIYPSSYRHVASVPDDALLDADEGRALVRVGAVQRVTLRGRADIPKATGRHQTAAKGAQPCVSSEGLQRRPLTDGARPRDRRATERRAPDVSTTIEQNSKDPGVRQLDCDDARARGGPVGHDANVNLTSWVGRIRRRATTGHRAPLYAARRAGRPEFRGVDRRSHRAFT